MNYNEKYELIDLSQEIYQECRYLVCTRKPLL